MTSQIVRVFPPSLSPLRFALMAGAAAVTLSACGEPLDWDLRDIGGDTLDTSIAARHLPDRPAPDSRGVISYPNYQVVVAQRGDTVRSVSQRLALDAQTLANYNGIEPDAPLRAGEIIALPTRVTEPVGGVIGGTIGGVAGGGAVGGGVNVSSLAGDAINRAESGTAPSALSTPSSEPFRHLVVRGETAYSIARIYNVPVNAIGEWNALPADLSIREGQYLLIPRAGEAPPLTSVSTAPGQGSPTPTPPSASAPLPQTASTAAPATPAAPDIGQAAAGASASPLVYPVTGPIIRAYARGRNDGIDIGAPAGTPVKAAAAGVVAAVTRDTNGVAVVVIRHDNNLLTVYTNLDELTVQKDSRVTQGQTIGKVKAAATPFLHFEVREGLESVDPADYLP